MYLMENIHKLMPHDKSVAFLSALCPSHQQQENHDKKLGENDEDVTSPSTALLHALRDPKGMVAELNKGWKYILIF